MRRREFIAGVAGAAASRCSVGKANKDLENRILMAGHWNSPSDLLRFEAFRNQLMELG